MTILNTRERVQLFCSESTLTKQSFKDECNINKIVQKFAATGQMPNLNNLEAQYGEAPTIDLKESLDLVKNLHREFDDLTPEIQARFGGNAQNYAQFLSDYENNPERFYTEREDQTLTNVSDEVNTAEKEALAKPTE